MSDKRKTYKGRKIVIKGTEAKAQLHIDGRLIETYFDEASGRYHSTHLPYDSYASLDELAKAAVDNVPNL